MSRARKLTIAVLATLLIAAPFVPRGADPDRSLTPSGEPTPGALSADLQEEIDRVVAEGRAANRAVGGVSARTAPASLVEQLVRCAEFDGERYCLGTGWTTRSEEAVQSDFERATTARMAPREATGDLDPMTALTRRARLSGAELARAERLELTDAALSVSKVQQVQSRAKTGNDYPQRSVVLRPGRTRQQFRSYWCGPATMQMIAWGWHGERQSQKTWSRRLGTTTNGTAITQIVRQINQRTGWDRESRAGRYITLDISGYRYSKWALLVMRHVKDYRAPLVFHPILHKRYYPYLDDDASGHFQVGRGYDKRGREPMHVSYFEPWNQQRFDRSEPFIGRVQWRSAYKSFRANKAHFQHNIGV